MADLNKIIEDLSSLTVVEAAELSKQLEEKWGVTAAAAVASRSSAKRSLGAGAVSKDGAASASASAKAVLESESWKKRNAVIKEATIIAAKTGNTSLCASAPLIYIY